MKLKIILSSLCVLTLTAALDVIAFHQRNHPVQVAVAGPKTFEVRGQIRSVDVAGKVVRITHEEIPNYMPAMTMPFSVKDPALLEGLVAGDSVQFQLVITEDDSWIARVQKIRADVAVESLVPSQSSDAVEARESERVQIGELVPDFQLVDQDGHSIHLSDYRGKAVMLTFIYTRCPLPNFCPLMSRNFSQLERRLSSEFTNQYHLLSVSMDSEFDTPEVLKAYGARYKANSKDWTFATGTSEQIQSVAGLMGLYYAKENGLISHDLRTALIGPDGRLVQLWKSNVWVPYEVQRMVRETISGTKDVAAR
jgi:protein SCO1/2